MRLTVMLKRSQGIKIKERSGEFLGLRYYDNAINCRR